MKSLELSTIFTVAPPLMVSWMPSSVGREFLTISSVPSGWTRTATVPGVALETGNFHLGVAGVLGSSILTVGAVSELRVALTSTGALTASPDFFASSMALLLRVVSAVVWPCLSVFTVAVEPSAALVSVTELPSFFVSVLVVLPSLPVVVSTLVPSDLVSVLVTEPSGFVTVSVLTVLPEEGTASATGADGVEGGSPVAVV